MTSARFRWRPDTCDCVLAYDGVGEQGEMLNPVMVQPCKMHAGISGNDIVAIVMDRNHYKNHVHKTFLDQGADPETLKVGYDGDVVTVSGHGFLTAHKHKMARDAVGAKYVNRKMRVD